MENSKKILPHGYQSKARVLKLLFECFQELMCEIAVFSNGQPGTYEYMR